MSKHAHTPRDPSPFERGLVAIACLLMGLLVPIALVLPYLLAVAMPGQ
jgi:hypothetical protein